MKKQLTVSTLVIGMEYGGDVLALPFSRRRADAERAFETANSMLNRDEQFILRMRIDGALTVDNPDDVDELTSTSRLWHSATDYFLDITNPFNTQARSRAYANVLNAERSLAKFRTEGVCAIQTSVFRDALPNHIHSSSTSMFIDVTEADFVAMLNARVKQYAPFRSRMHRLFDVPGMPNVDVDLVFDTLEGIQRGEIQRKREIRIKPKHGEVIS